MFAFLLSSYNILSNYFKFWKLPFLCQKYIVLYISKGVIEHIKVLMQ